MQLTIRMIGGKFFAICMYSIASLLAIGESLSADSTNTPAVIKGKLFDEGMDASFTQKVSESREWFRKTYGSNVVSSVDIEQLGNDEVVSGSTSRKSAEAALKLRSLGDKTLLALTDATQHENAKIRVMALALITDVAIKQKLGERVLPVLQRSQWDVNSSVRAAATGQIGRLGRILLRDMNAEQTKVYVDSLVRVLNDKDASVQYIAGTALDKMGRRDLVPDAVIKKLGIGEEQFKEKTRSDTLSESSKSSTTEVIVTSSNKVEEVKSEPKKNDEK